METERLIMRRWREDDREPFGALNADPEVMEHFPAPLTRSQSDAMVDRIELAFDEHGYGLWALEVRETGRFIGFTGLAWQRFEAPFTPALEVGWRLARHAWGHGYAVEAAGRAVAEGFAVAGVDEIVSMTTRRNARSRAVMERLGMTRDPSCDFDHPAVPSSHPLRPHVLYRLRRPWRPATVPHSRYGG
ncbi:GNAT family N-acetyltransferase [Streptosporangium sp. NPDC023963]|uniref:GNAT family N-acetyltransferase n=1 Tax=Streptosporangium sp. NPDC023963 TaxID=3155608 RepID=UPI00343AB5B6